MRSGMRSWSKWVIFSRRMKSSSSVGPRRPAFSEFWLSAIGTPWLVVSTWPPESTRTRSSGPIAGIEPGGGAPSPVLAEAFASVSVLPVTAGSGGFAVAPGLGVLEAAPISLDLLALNGKAAARVSVSRILRTAESPPSPRGAFFGPLTVALAAPLPVVSVLRFFCTNAFLPGCQSAHFVPGGSSGSKASVRRMNLRCSCDGDRKRGSVVFQGDRTRSLPLRTACRCGDIATPADASHPDACDFRNDRPKFHAEATMDYLCCAGTHAMQGCERLSSRRDVPRT